MPRLARAEPTFILEDEPEEEEEENEMNMKSQWGTFSQILPDQSQFLAPARENEQKKLNALNPTARNQVITDLSRILLFKALGGDAIDRTKCVAEALGENMKKERVQTAVCNEATDRLRKVFGFNLIELPEKETKDLPARFKNRLYLINRVKDDEVGTHCTNIHGAHADSSVEKGVLMMILAFAFCKGQSQVRSGQMKGAGKKTRWITEHHLYHLLNRVDENIPSEPPSSEGKKKSRQSTGGGRKSIGSRDEEGVGETPDIDALLERFVQMDYILRDKIEETGGEGFAGEDGKVIAYAMGPRATMEIGRRQIIFFCANLLEEQPDPTMLKELDDDKNEEEEESEGEEEVQQEKKKRRKKNN